MPQTYPRPWSLVPGLVGAMIARRQRSFHRDAQAAVHLLKPPLEIRGREHIPASGPFLLTINHYGRLGFPSWWLTMAPSSALPVEVHWIMTGAWIFLDRWYTGLVRDFTRWLFRQVAGVYGFYNMTPIAPYSNDVEERARSVRRVLEYAHRTTQPVIGLAPEGRNHPDAVLGPLPPSAGRFIARLANACQVILPAGIFEEDGRLCVHFGAPYLLETPAGLSGDALDEHVGQVVMRAIAHLLPANLRGEYA